MIERIQQTSIDALREEEASGRLRGKRLLVAQAFAVHGPGTSAEVLRAAKLDANRNLMRARVTELADYGWLKKVDTRKCAITGRQAIVWRFERTEPRPPMVSRGNLVKMLNESIAIARVALDNLPPESQSWVRVQRLTLDGFIRRLESEQENPEAS